MKEVLTPELITSLQELSQILDRYDTIVFDLGDVLLHWDSVHFTSETKGIDDVRKMVKHPVWQDLEKGLINQEFALTALSCELETPCSKLKEMLELSIASLQVNPLMVEVLRVLHKKDKQIYCLSNVDLESFSYLYKQFDFWKYFDGIYVSALLQLRKPNPDIFQYLISSASINTKSTIFIDDKSENLQEAANFGISTLKYNKDNFEYTAIEGGWPIPLQNMTPEIHKKRTLGEDYLNLRLRKFPFCKSFVSNNVELIGGEDFSKEIFSTAVILHSYTSLPDDIIASMCHEILNHDGQNKLRWCFYKNEARPDNFPDDLDTTSMVLSFLLNHNKLTIEKIIPVAEQMIANRNEEGIIQVYFDDNRPRIDAIVAINVLYLMHQIGYGERKELKETEAFVFDFLISKEYLKGTRYYPAPDVFLFFLSRLVVDFPDQFEKFHKPLTEMLITRVNCSTFPLERALRIIALKKLGIVNRVDFLKLLDTQLADGGWPVYGLFIAPRSNTYFGSRELSTAFALEALHILS
ncbi:HAD-IA family hydrolase [Aquimarina spongiae]|uniref:Haloacid dehalogenase superfamily, subfamily IA, variant 3 with third motif having DD or ED n=1 Tax=Aquimarina spongiae TaxID=570521 RepID=A0A1M6CXF0_9FLAO|nr:HAD-IA family hydrolase [Aquimarina spongiae]SHI65418.1 haloacid dehalogenase superfamily, subfamily IA, variant 3 with third motif having DD or ED [Aquimarina spongiae]